ncbi:MAG: hypothetical protein K5637_06190 [Lachnospiraceae bacterium]|nr:hypothetical protein [Lachnospiraceae bacterium]
MEDLSYREQLEALIADYRSYLKKLPEKGGIFSGFLEILKKPQNDPGHNEFYNNVGKLAEQAAESEDPEAVRELAEALLFASAEIYDRESSYLYLTAIQRHAMPLLERLSESEKAAFLERYEEEYPKKRRLPVQNDIIKLLEK